MNSSDYQKVAYIEVSEHFEQLLKIFPNFRLKFQNINDAHNLRFDT